MNLINKIVKIVLMMILILCIFTGYSKAAISGKVTADNIRLRKEANTESKILTLISINEKVEVIEKEGEWYKISYKTHTGYTKKEFIKLESDSEKESIKQENTSIENTDNESNTQNVDNTQNTTTEQNNTSENIETAKTVSNTQSIYILPLINSSNIGEIQANTEIEIIQNTNGWSYVTALNICGWIRTEKLVNMTEKVEQEEKLVEEKHEQDAKKEEKKEIKVIEINKTGYIKKTSVNLRKGPSTEEEKIASLALNTEIKVISEENGWYKVQVNKKTGYILKELVSFEKVEVTSRNLETPRQEEQTTTTTPEVNDVPKDNTSSDLGKQIVDYAMTFVGYPYVYGGSTPSGFDCSGFTSYVYKHFGYSISRTSSAQASNGKAVSKADLQLGDLVLFKGQNSSRIGHVGIYIGNNQFVHASTEKTGVKVSSLSTSGYIKRYVTARRII